MSNENSPPQMSTPRFIAVSLAACISAMVGMCFLPSPEYSRFFQVDERGKLKAPWIYERIHFDETPIDVAFFGTSRTDGAIATRLLEDELEAKLGRKVEVVNFAVQNNGRNMQYALMKELFEHREVKLVMIEVGTLEDRYGHPHFVLVADDEDIVTAPVLINLKYVDDLLRLPGRDFFLFGSWLTEKLGLTASPSEGREYFGDNFDRVARIPLRVEGEFLDRDRENSREKQEELAANYAAGITPALFPRWMEALEYRMERYYVDKLAVLAKAHGSTMGAHFLPLYGRFEIPRHVEALRRDRLPLVSAPDFIRDHRCWLDADHLNARCGERYTKYMAGQIAPLLESDSP